MTAIGIVATVLYFLLLTFFILMWVRFIVDFARALRPAWRPRGPVLVLAEVAYAVTDPPVKLVRRVVPPVTLGVVRLDLAWSIVLLICIIAMTVVGSL